MFLQKKCSLFRHLSLKTIICLTLKSFLSNFQKRFFFYFSESVAGAQTFCWQSHLWFRREIPRWVWCLFWKCRKRDNSKQIQTLLSLLPKPFVSLVISYFFFPRGENAFPHRNLGSNPAQLGKVCCFIPLLKLRWFHQITFLAAGALSKVGHCERPKILFFREICELQKFPFRSFDPAATQRPWGRERKGRFCCCGHWPSSYWYKKKKLNFPNKQKTKTYFNCIWIPDKP